jgi:hypothetical protein
MNRDNQGLGRQAGHRQIVEYAIPNLSSASSLFFEGQVYSTQQAPWGLNVIQTQTFEPTSEGQGMSRASRQRVADAPERTRIFPSRI